MAGERIETEISLREDDEDKSGRIVVDNGSTSTEADGDEDLKIVEVDDTPNEDRNRRPYAGPTRVPPEDDDSEIGEYTQGVQKRLREMRREYHDERRAKEQWQREHNAAVDFAKRIHAENTRLRRMIEEGHKTIISSAKESAENEMRAIQESLKAALENGNTGLAAELQGKLATAAARAEAQNHIQPIQFQDDGVDIRQGQEQQQERQERQPQVRLSEKMTKWVEDNPWFGQNDRMTSFAFGVHQELHREGVVLESPKYFQELDKAMKETFPGYFDGNDGVDRSNRTSNGNGSSQGRGQPSNQRRGTTVAGVSRTTNANQGRNSVEITASEKRLALKMGIPLKEYAKEKLRLSNLDGEQ